MEQSSLVGQLLIAVPDLLDPNFNQSVVLIVQHDQDGASGLVLNRPTNTKLGEIFSEEPAIAGADDCVYIGGPVEGPVMALHGCVSLSEKDVLENVYFSLGRENLLGIVNQTLRPFRVFCGYSGWGKNQLDNEIALGGWLVVPASAELVFGTAENLWNSVSDQVGLEIIFSKPVVQPVDPSVN